MITASPAIQFLNLIFDPSDRICIASKRTDEEMFETGFGSCEEICGDQYLDKIAGKNDAGSNIYITMNSISADATRRRKEDIGEIRSTYLDLDSNGKEKLDAIMSSKHVPKPTVVLESSPGKYQVIWSVRGITKGQQEGLLKALISLFGGDPAVKDCSRVLRLPGFVNNKYVDAPMVNIVFADENRRVYGLQDFDIKISAAADPETAKSVTRGDDPIPEGQRDTDLASIAGKWREDGLEYDEIYSALSRVNQERCKPPKGNADIVRIAKSICRYPKGVAGPTVLIGGKLPGAASVKQEQTAQELVIDTNEACTRPVFPYEVMEGTSLFEGLVKPAVENSSKHSEFVFIPAVQLMLNYLSGKVRMRMQDVNLNLFVGLVSPPGQFFKSSSCGLAHDYFKAAGVSMKHTRSSILDSDGRVVIAQAGSSEGFGLAMKSMNARHAILFSDELAKFASKAGIENSSLPHDLLTWYESGDFGNTVKSSKDSFSFESGSYCFGWQWCTTDRGFNRQWPRVAGVVSGLEDRMFFVVSPEKPREPGLYRTPPMEEAAKKTQAIIEAAILKGVYDFESLEKAQRFASELQDPRSMQMLLAFALYFAIDLQRDTIDSDCLERARKVVEYRNRAINFLAPIEADNEQGRLQQEIMRELRKSAGKMKYRDMCRNMHANRCGTDRWNAAYFGLVKSGIIADFNEKTKSGQMCRMTALLILND